jgi:uroporphyrinogen decarboxylase
MILDAAESIKKRIGSYTKVSIGISGPFSICAELAGFEKLIIDCMSDDNIVYDLLKKILDHQKEYCNEIIKRGLGITLFESWAAPPLISPDIYKNFVMPYEKQLISYIREQDVHYIPLVIGGDTTAIIHDMIETGTSLLISDYKTDINYFVENAKENNLAIRGNIDPKLIERGPVEEIIMQLEVMLKKVNGYNKFIVGSGVLPYNTPSENVLAIRKYLENMQ